MKKWLPEELEEIPCDFCGARETAKQFIRKDGMRVVECAQCGLAYLNPRPKSEFITRFYDPDYFTGAAAGRGEGGLRCNLNPTPAEQQTDSQVMEIVAEKFGGFWGKEVLEIGCATGDFLALIQARGANTIGLELSEFASKIARGRGLNVITGSLEQYSSQSNQQYDLVIAHQVIEHVLSPYMFIKCISMILRPGGLLLLSTPNFACAKRFQDKWFGFNTSYEHLYFFSLDVLKSIATRYKLSLIYWETSSYNGSIHVSSNAFKRQVFRFRTYLLLVRGLGVSKAAHVILRRKANFHPYGNGHTLCCLFQR